MIRMNNRIDTDGLRTVRKVMMNILALAVKHRFPRVKLGAGSATENGCYYDFDLPLNLTKTDLEKIEKDMRQITSGKRQLKMRSISAQQAHDLFQQVDEIYQADVAKNAQQTDSTGLVVWEMENCSVLSKLTYLPQINELSTCAFSIDSVAGAYWNGNEQNPMLTRIYVLVFETNSELLDFLDGRKEAEKRDHRKLGRELDIFTISDSVGKGLPLFLPKGAILRRILESFIIDEEISRGYELVNTPVLGRKELYEQSGHMAHYKDSMYPPIDVDGTEYILRPMTCPHHIALYQNRPRSYRDLPIRYTELSPLYRKEKSGELYGLIRIMSFHLADSHIFCRPEQVEVEFLQIVQLVQYVMKAIGLVDRCWYRASLHDEQSEKYIDDSQFWETSEDILLNLIDKAGIDYRIERGEAAFYGPKLDIQMKNIQGKDETLFTIQIDRLLPERFDLSYTDTNGKLTRPVMLHRSSVGCIERTIAYLLEAFSGAFPTWMVPVQVMVLPINNAFASSARVKLNKALSLYVIGIPIDRLPYRIPNSSSD